MPHEIHLSDVIDAASTALGRHRSDFLAPSTDPVVKRVRYAIIQVAREHGVPGGPILKDLEVSSDVYLSVGERIAKDPEAAAVCDAVRAVLRGEAPVLKKAAAPKTAAPAVETVIESAVPYDEIQAAVSNVYATSWATICQLVKGSSQPIQRNSRARRVTIYILHQTLSQT